MAFDLCVDSAPVPSGNRPAAVDGHQGQPTGDQGQAAVAACAAVHPGVAQCPAVIDRPHLPGAVVGVARIRGRQQTGAATTVSGIVVVTPQETPTTSMVCWPTGVFTGIVTVVSNFPVPSAVVVPSSTGSECRTNRIGFEGRVALPGQRQWIRRAETSDADSRTPGLSPVCGFKDGAAK